MAAEYKQLLDPLTGGISSTILRIVDQAYIPDDPANADFQRYSVWLEDGNTPDPPDAIPPITVIPSFDFLSRFTYDEQLEMNNAASTDATLGAGLTNLSTATETDLEGESVSNWLDGLIDARVIAEERKAELLAPVDPNQPSTARSVWR